MRALLSSTVAIATLLPASSALAEPSADAAATANAQIRDFLFRPAYTRIEPGDSVVWTQAGSLHTVTSRRGAPESFDSGDLTSGKQFTRSFPTSGRYPYLCTIHEFMRGVVQVGPDTTKPALTKVKSKGGSKSVRVSFRLSEDAKVSLRIARASKPGRVLRQSKARQLSEGARSLSLATSGLAPGSYRVDVRAVDRERNVGSARAGTIAIAH